MGFKLFLLLEKFLLILPKGIRKSFFTLLAFIAYHASARYRNVAKQNLEFAFDGKISKEKIKEITKYSFKNLLLNFMHLMEFKSMSNEDLAKKVKIVNLQAVTKVHKEGRAVIYIASHYCAWELGVASISTFAEPIAAIYKKMKNQAYQEWLLDARANFGSIPLEKSNVIRPIIKLIKKQKASGILIDTNINPREGVIVNFMGKNIRQTSTPAYLARKFNAAIIPVSIRTDDEENYTMTIYDEIKVNKTDNEKKDIQEATQLQADWLTKLIEDEPKFWFWIHRRWKNDYPEIYKK